MASKVSKRSKAGTVKGKRFDAQAFGDALAAIFDDGVAAFVSAIADANKAQLEKALPFLPTDAIKVLAAVRSDVDAPAVRTIASKGSKASAPEIEVNCACDCDGKSASAWGTAASEALGEGDWLAVYGFKNKNTGNPYALIYSLSEYENKQGETIVRAIGHRPQDVAHVLNNLKGHKAALKALESE